MLQSIRPHDPCLKFTASRGASNTYCNVQMKMNNAFTGSATFRSNERHREASVVGTN